MAGEVNISLGVTQLYREFMSSIHPWFQTFINIAFIAILVTLFFMFIYKLYHIICKKNLLELNLKQYNTSYHPGFKKFMGAILYLIEYIIIFPFFVVFWFFIFTIFVMLLAKGLDFATVLTISTVIIIVIRTTAYYKESLSKEIAKLLPFTMLVVAITEKEFFSFEQIFSRVAELPLFFENILVYIGVIVVIEIILRTFSLLFSLFKEDSRVEKFDELIVPKKEDY